MSEAAAASQTLPPILRPSSPRGEISSRAELSLDKIDKENRAKSADRLSVDFDFGAIFDEEENSLLHR